MARHFTAHPLAAIPLLRDFARYNDLMTQQAAGALTTGETAYIWWGYSSAFSADLGRRLEATRQLLGPEKTPQEGKEKQLIGSYLAPRHLIFDLE